MVTISLFTMYMYHFEIWLVTVLCSKQSLVISAKT